MTTKNKLKYISPAKEGYENLGVEILDLHKITGDISRGIEEVKESIKGLDPSLNSEIIETLREHGDDIATLKTNVVDINNEIEKIRDNHINTGFENISVNKEYQYDIDGRIIKEISTGDIERVIEYKYNDIDLITDEIIYENGIEVGRKEYQYNLDGDVYKIKSTNADMVNLAVMDYAIKDVEGRLKELERVMNVGHGSDIANIYKILSDLSVQVEVVTSLLPDNITSLVDIPRLIERIDELENRVNRQHVKFRFVVIGGKTEYEIPSNITDDSSVYLEGLLLDYGDDYVIENGYMIFNIPLIDGFEVQCKY